MKRYRELYVVEINERDPPLAVTRLIDHLTTQMPGLVIMVLIEIERVRGVPAKPQAAWPISYLYHQCYKERQKIDPKGSQCSHTSDSKIFEVVRISNHLEQR